ncbi:hypothetical protein BH18ACT4_BH18ACT4_04090 [soil metagenome]
MDCLDFELQLGVPAGRAVEVCVLDSPAGEATAVMTFPFDTLALENRLQAVQLALISRGATRRRMVPAHEQDVRSFGAALYDALFAGEIGSLFDRSRAEALREGKGLRLRLRFGDAAELASLPWEFLFDSRRDEYVCLSSATPIVRYLELGERQEPLAVAPPLRILAMVASPRDLPALDVVQEQARITTALAPLVASGRVELHWLAGQTWRDLQQGLRRGEWHALHFVGHGGFDAHSDEGMVALADDEGCTQRLGATELGRLLGDHFPLRLAVLNSCEGARVDKLDVFSSTAATLVRRGTPAVVAMQYEITDAAAVELARSFYTALADGIPVDVALGEARKAVSVALPGTLEWGTPVLYLRAPDGRIFDVDPIEPTALADPVVPPTLGIAIPPAAPIAPTTPQSPPGREPPVIEPAASAPPRTMSRSPLLIAALLGLCALAVLLTVLFAGSNDGDSESTSDTNENQTSTDIGVPDDWVQYEDPATGFTIYHPPAWNVRPQGGLTDFVDPDSGALVRVEYTDEPGDDAVQAWRDLASLARSNAGYEELRIEPVEFRDFEAAVWEFRVQEGGQVLHTVDLGVITGDYGFALLLRAPEASFPDLAEVFLQFQAGFDPPTTAPTVDGSEGGGEDE